MLVLPTIEAVLSWLRIFSSDGAIDDISNGFLLCEVKGEKKGAQLLVQVLAQNSRMMDRVANVAKWIGVPVFTGTTKHFVRYRDANSPYGYDVVDVDVLEKTKTFRVYNLEDSEVYTYGREIQLRDLLVKCSLRKKSVRVTDDYIGGKCWLLCEKGLSSGVLRYLWKNQIKGRATIVGVSQKGKSSPRVKTLIEVESLPDRILGLLDRTPGVATFGALSEHVGVEMGYEHPIGLEQCETLFGNEALHLFDGANDTFLEFKNDLQFLAIESLISNRFEIAANKTTQTLEKNEFSLSKIALELTSTRSPPKNINASFVPLGKAGQLKKLVFALPPRDLQEHGIVSLESGFLIVGKTEFTFPLGEPLTEVFKGLYLPIGIEWVPRVSADAMAKAIGHERGMITVLLGGDEGFRVLESAVVPLEQQVIGSLEITESAVLDHSLGAISNAPQIVNQPLSPFALWGFQGQVDKKLKK